MSERAHADGASSDLRGIAFEVLRVTIELRSPLTIGIGDDGDLVDVACAVDANGLPTIPGSSIAGVLRHLAAGEADPDLDDDCRRAFGYQERDEGEASLVEVSFAQVHGRHDRPIEMRAAQLEEDEILAHLVAGITRDHVRIDGRGVVDRDGKFDVSSVPTGARFTFELVVHDGCPWSATELIGLLASPAARLGGSTRRGLGAFSIVRAFGRRFDLRRPADRADFLRLPRALHEPPPAQLLPPVSVVPKQPDGLVSGRLELAPEDLWITAGGDPAIVGDVDPDPDPDRERSRQLPDMAPLSERQIEWKEDGAHLAEPAFLLPGSAIKGALRHRTAFHARRLRGEWAGQARPEEVPRELLELFGEIKADDDGRPGRVFIDDAWPANPARKRLEHVSLDRFSGGPLSGHLFDEVVLGACAIEVELLIDCRPSRDPDGSDELATALEALRAALGDVCEGRLALGGGANRGHGYMRGTLHWDHDAPWEAPR